MRSGRRSGLPEQAVLRVIGEYMLNLALLKGIDIKLADG